MIIIEIILTVVAWKRGWKWWALLPGCSVIVLAFLMGMAIGASGGAVTDSFTGLMLLLDGSAIIALLVMSIVGKKDQPPGISVHDQK